MTTNRHLRIVAVLAAKGPLETTPLTTEINSRFVRTYPPSLIFIDLKTLIADGQVMVNNAGLFLITEYGRTVSRKPRWVDSQPDELMAA
ncbi:MAG: hypothetical protein WCG73_01330 [Candidatus Moraniibacteriota bacterium]